MQSRGKKEAQEGKTRLTQRHYTPQQPWEQAHTPAELLPLSLSSLFPTSILSLAHGLLPPHITPRLPFSSHWAPGHFPYSGRWGSSSAFSLLLKTSSVPGMGIMSDWCSQGCAYSPGTDIHPHQGHLPPAQPLSKASLPTKKVGLGRLRLTQDHPARKGWQGTELG